MPGEAMNMKGIHFYLTTRSPVGFFSEVLLLVVQQERVLEQPPG
jgi:hypothetical protein